MLKLSARLAIPDHELRLSYVRSGGPGGQNVNKVASAVLLQFNFRASPSLPEECKSLLENYPDSRIGKDGVITIRASRYRSQELNRQDALNRLATLIGAALKPKTPRRPTKPTRTSLQKRLEAKKRRGQIKRERTGKDNGGE
ncbi:MAG: aminoacyl-tRNA hydrolase [Deltaproteobacteria bacterium]|nr:aminoacyl-tRNA hydrolase [Deltaproteobacteria bacterium]